MIDTIWQEFLSIVAQEAGTHVVHTWLNAVTLKQWDALENVIYLQAPNTFVCEWIKANYLPLFHTHLCRLLNVDSLRVHFTNQEATELVPTNKQIIPAVSLNKTSQTGPAQPIDVVPSVRKAATIRQKNFLNKNYSFQNFVVGPSNQLAYAAAVAVSEKPGKLYNPLFIYGGSGLGKTHLLHAIGNEIQVAHKRVEVLYVTADHFVNEFINAIRFDKVTQFKERYYALDILLIDDVQFISNKEQTQEAFFHIFNALYQAHKQIVFSSDSDPANINGLAERLRSRFEWGLVSDIQMPALETKVAILKRKAELAQQQIEDEVLYYIASRVISNIRELEGALIRITAYAQLVNLPITLELAKKLFQRHREVKEAVLDFQTVVNCLSRKYRYTLTDLRSQHRNKEISHVRQLAMYLMKKLTNKSLQEIGHYLARKDHTTVMHAIQRIQRDIATDTAFGLQVQEIEQELLNE